MKNKTIPFFRPSVGKDEIDAVSECISSGWLTSGPKVLEFEREFESFLGNGTTAIAVNSATAALHLGLEAMGVTADDEVILPTLTFTATAEVVRYLGAKPVFVDIDPNTLCMEENACRSAITAKTKALIPVHFAGRPCNMSALRQLADEHGLSILDDAAHALPAAHAGINVGKCYSDATAFSFYANKTMTTGEGGMLTTSNPEIAERAKTMRLHGIDRDVFNRFTDVKASWIYDVIAPGYKYNLTDIAAAIGVVQLRKIHQFHKRRSDLASIYNTAFQELPFILPPVAETDDIHSWHLYILQLKDVTQLSRDELMRRLQAAGIGCSVHYRPLHQMTVWKPYCQNKTFLNADSYFESCISLPLFMDMSDIEQERVISVVKDIFS